MELVQFVPLAAIGLAIVVTELYKNIGFIKPETIQKTIWIPPLITGLAYAILTYWGQPWNEILKEAFICSAGAAYAVLIAKRTIAGGGQKGETK